jgi:signal transduction histidine kinase
MRSISADDRDWLRSLGADTYVPVFDGEQLSALMAIGPRQSGDPYRQADLDLLSSIADQTSVALKNARLVTNLRILNEQMRDLYENSAVLNKELGQSNERLRQMDKVKTDFINIASHELRTPLTKLRGFSDILHEMTASGTVDASTVEMVTKQLSKASIRLEEVLGQMLDVSQLDVEALELSYAHTSLASILQMAAEHFKPALAERKQTLRLRDTQGLPSIQADHKRLTQTFRQIIGNAIKFTPDNGRIDIYANHLPPNEDRDRPEAIEVVVADSGVGINPEHYELIFEKFYRVGSVDLHSTGDTKFMGAGPGLGLTIARGVVKAHGGQMWVESDGFDPKACPGSQFHIILPIQHIEPAPKVEPVL